MYALARLGSKSLPGMREAFETGVKIIIKNQLPTGGWGYSATGGYRDSGGSDPSVTGWHYQALKAAKLSGLNFAGLHQSIDKAMKYLASIQTKDGGFGGANREAGAYTQWTMTGVAVLGLQTLGHGEQAKIKKGVKWAYEFYQKEPPVWKDANFYAWYYIAQIFFQNGGAGMEVLERHRPPGNPRAPEQGWKLGHPHQHPRRHLRRQQDLPHRALHADARSLLPLPQGGRSRGRFDLRPRPLGMR